MKDDEASIEKGRTECDTKFTTLKIAKKIILMFLGSDLLVSNSSEKGEGDKAHTSSATKPAEKYSDSLAESSSEGQLATPTTEEEERVEHQSTNFNNSHSGQISQSGGNVQSATPTNGVGSRPIDTQPVQGNKQVDKKQRVQNAQHTDGIEQLPDNGLKELAAKLGLYWRQDQVSGLTREQLISMLKAAHEAGGASWAQFWRVLSLSHTSKLPNNHLLVRLGQWFATPQLEFPLGEHGIVQGQTSQPRYKGIPISIVESQRPGRAINYYDNACLIIDPCTMKSMGDWKLVTKTQSYNAHIKTVGSEPREMTEDALLDRDERKVVHFATTKDLSNGLIARVPKSGPPEVVWDEKQESRLSYLGDFPFQAYWGGPSYHQRITLGMIPIVEDLFPRHMPAPLASGTEIRLVLGQDFIEHKQYYKYVIERETQDLTIDWDFQVHRNPNVNVNESQQTMKCFVDGFYRDGAEWAAMYHVTGSWFNGIVLLATGSSNTDKPVFITVKALWKALMQVQELMMRLIGSKLLPLRLVIYVLQRDVAAAFENNWAVIKRWESKGWTRAGGRPVANRDLWEQLLSAIRQMKTLLNIEVSIQYDPANLDPRELQKYNLGIKCLKTLKKNVPPYVNLRRPDVADYFLKATINNNAMGVDVKGINYRGSQCDVLLPEKLQELAYSLQNEGCMKCNSVHKIYLPIEQVGESRGTLKEGICPLLSQLPDSMTSESSVSRETIAMHDLLGPYDELNPTRPFGHQLCLCTPDSEAMKEALAILCNTHVIVYGHHNWIAVDKKELMLSLAEADEVGLPGDLEIYGSDKWINYLKSKPGGAEAFEEYKKGNSKKIDPGKKAVNKRMRKKAKANKSLGTGQTEENPDAEKEGEGFPTDRMSATVLNDGRLRVRKAHKDQVIGEDQVVHEWVDVNGPMEGPSGAMEVSMGIIGGGETKEGGKEVQPIQIAAEDVVGVDGVRGEDSQRGDDHTSRTVEYPEGSKNQQRKEKKARRAIEKEKETSDGGAAVSCALDGNFDVEEMEKELQKYKELAANDWRTTEADAGDAEDEASDGEEDELEDAADQYTGKLQLDDEDDLHSPARVVPMDTLANHNDKDYNTLASVHTSGISDLDLGPGFSAGTEVEGRGQVDVVRGVGPTTSLHNPNHENNNNQWKPEGRSWADDEDDSEAERAFWEQLYADTRKYLPSGGQGQRALQPRDLTAKEKEKDVTKSAEAGPSRLRNPWRRNVDIEYANETPRNRVPLVTTQREIEEAAKEMALKGTFPTSNKASGMVALGHKSRSRTATKTEEGEHDDEGRLESEPTIQEVWQRRTKAEQEKGKAWNLTTAKTGNRPMRGGWGIPTPTRAAEDSTTSGGLNLGVFPTLGSAVGKGIGKEREIRSPINKNAEMRSDYGRGELTTFGGFAKTQPGSKMGEDRMEKREIHRNRGGSTQAGWIPVNAAQPAEVQ